MTVYRRENGRYAVQIYDPAIRRMRQVGTYPTRRDARKAESDAINRSTAAGRETVGTFHDRWLATFPRPKQSTMMRLRERTAKFATEYRHRRIDSITVEEARRWAVERRSDLPGLRVMMNDARKLGLVTTNPFSALGLERSRGRRDLPSEWLTATDVHRLSQIALKAHGAYGPMMATMVTFAAYTGVRQGELFALEWSDLGANHIDVRRSADSHSRTVTTPKNGRSRQIVYPAIARRAVEEMPRFHGQETVFVAPRGGRLWAPHFNWLWNPVRVAFDRPTMAWHELRHFCATYLLELGLAASDVAVQLGHTDNGKLVMDTYGHPSERAARSRILAAVDGLDQGELAPIRERKGAEG
jgi:integrase